MSHNHGTTTLPHTLPGFALRPEATERWGDLSVDQADGFAPVHDVELPGSDLNDDRGYGFGV